MPLNRASKNPLNKSDINNFKAAADRIDKDPKPELKLKRISQWIKQENWKYLKDKAAEETCLGDDRVTVNQLLDRAIELLKKEEGV